jgi:hypothetical protein
MRRRERDRLFAVPGLGDDLDLGLAREARPDTLARVRIVVTDQQTQHRPPDVRGIRN